GARAQVAGGAPGDDLAPGAGRALDNTQPVHPGRVDIDLALVVGGGEGSAGAYTGEELELRPSATALQRHTGAVGERGDCGAAVRNIVDRTGHGLAAALGESADCRSEAGRIGDLSDHA